MQQRVGQAGWESPRKEEPNIGRRATRSLSGRSVRHRTPTLLLNVGRLICPRLPTASGSWQYVSKASLNSEGSASRYRNRGSSKNNQKPNTADVDGRRAFGTAQCGYWAVAKPSTKRCTGWTPSGWTGSPWNSRPKRPSGPGCATACAARRRAELRTSTLSSPSSRSRTRECHKRSARGRIPSVSPRRRAGADRRPPSR